MVNAGTSPSGGRVGRAPALALADLEAFDPHPAGQGTERRFCCPLDACRDKPRDRAHQSLAANVGSGLWTCYRCGGKGKLADHWTPSPGAPGRELRRRRALQAFAVAPEPAPGRAASAPRLRPMLDASRPIAGTPGEAYLARRGIPAELATAAGVRFSGDWYGRPAVVFPLRDQAGAVVGANGRHTDGRSDPKTHTVGDRALGVFATADALGVGAVVLVEGPLDALSLAACGLPALALVATRAPAWLPRAAAFRRAVVALDADVEGDKAAGLLLDTLAPFAAGVERWRPQTGKDWNDALLADRAGLRRAVAEQMGPDWLPESCARCGRPVEAFDGDGTPRCARHAGAVS